MYTCNVHRCTPRSKRPATIFEEIEWIRGAWVTHVIKNRSMVGRRMVETSINEIVVASPIHPRVYSHPHLPPPSPFAVLDRFAVFTLVDVCGIPRVLAAISL